MSQVILTLLEAIKRAAAAYERGEFDQAERLAQAILEAKADHFDALHLIAVIKSARRRYAEALATYDRALTLQPDHPDALYNRGNALQELKRFEEALASYDRALAVRPDRANALNNRGNVLKELKRFDEALVTYDRALTLQPDHPDALYNRGNALQELKRFEEALASYDRALAVRPDCADALNNRGNVLKELKRFDEALASYDGALAVRPDYADALNNRGIALQELERFEDALASYDLVLAAQLNDAKALYNRGTALERLMRFEEALSSYDRAVAARPDYVKALNNRGKILWELKRFEEALASYDRALAIKPNCAEAFNNRGNALTSYDEALVVELGYADALNNRGIVLQHLKRSEEALVSYDRAIALKPDFAEAFSNRGIALLALNLNDRAIADFQRATQIKPDLVEARCAACIAELPILYRSKDDIVRRRAAYEQKLKEFRDDVIRGKLQGSLAKAIGATQPFFLAYQGYNDYDLQMLYGSLVCHIMQREYPPAQLPLPPSRGEPVRLGIISSFFWHHSNWKIPIKGWLSQLDRQRFKIFGYHLGERRDAETDVAATMCDRFVCRSTDVEGWRQEILADAPHVLIYPGLLMDPLSVQLAAQRLAPVQCNSWGHPETSGMPSLDYFLSSDLMEPPGADNHYSEKLIRLPNLSIYYEPHSSEPSTVRREDLGLRSDAVVFWCGQSLYKYLPQFDDVFARIATQAKHCQFVFVQYHEAQEITRQFQERLARAFAANGVNSADHCVMLPRLQREQFFAALGHCDVFLDSLEWSGCNSTLESLAHNLPIVTLPGALMRGRHSAGILRMMGVTDTIADTVDDYVAIAVRLAKDPQWRGALSQRIAECKHHVYRDRECIATLEDFLDYAARQ